MALSTEAWLALGILGFYVFDCLKLTEANRVYFTYAFARWGYRLPNQALHIGRRSIDLFNPIMPWQLQLPSSLKHQQVKTKQKFGKHFNKAILALAPIQIILSVCMLIGLPAVLLFVGLGQLFLLIFAMAYLCIGISLLKVYRSRKALNLSVAQCASLAAECLLCSPFAINLIRKVGLLQADVPDAAVFARSHFSPETLSQWRAQLGGYVREQQQWYLAEDPMHQQWQAIGKRIQGDKS